MLVDAAAMHVARGPQRTLSGRRHDDLDHAAIRGRPSPLDESSLFHAVDHAGQAALTRKDAAGELVHANPVLGLLEMDEDVVPAKRDALFVLELRVKDVDQRECSLEERSPDDELSLRRA